MDSDFRAACGSWLCIGFAWFLQYLWVLALFKKLTIGEVIELYVVVVAQLFRRLHTSHPPRCSGLRHLPESFSMPPDKVKEQFPPQDPGLCFKHV